MELFELKQLPRMVFRSAINCKKCKRFVLNRKNIVFGNGNFNSDIMLVGEAPGKEEDLNGFPFCNPKGAGGELDECLKIIGLTRKDIFITNTVLCRPPKNSDPTREEKKNCSIFFKQQIDIVDPIILVGLGRHGGNALLEFFMKREYDISLARLRTMSPFEVDYNRKKKYIFVTFHPASWLYNPKYKEEAKKDWIRIKELIDKIKLNIQVHSNQKNM